MRRQRQKCIGDSYVNDMDGALALGAALAALPLRRPTWLEEPQKKYAEYTKGKNAKEVEKKGKKVKEKEVPVKEKEKESAEVLAKRKEMACLI